MGWTASIFIILLAFFSFNLNTNYFHHKWFFFAVLAALLLSLAIGGCTNPALALLFFYSLSSAAYVGIFTQNRHFAHPKFGLTSELAYSCVKAYMALMGLGVILVSLTESMIFTIFEVMEYLLIINIVWTLLPTEWTKFKIEASDLKAPICGFGANTSVNATFLSLQAPFMMANFQKDSLYYGIILLFTLLAIIKTRASAGLFAFVLSNFLFFSLELEFSYLELFYACLGLLVLGLIADFFIRRGCPHNSLFNVSGRNHIYSFAKNGPWKKVNKPFGGGMGSFMFLMPAFQKTARQKGDPCPPADYCWLHSDIGQLLIEGGWVGITIAAVAFLWSLYICINSQNYAGQAFLVSYFINSAVNFPNHMAPDAFLTVVMARWIQIMS